jgi:hypothetical protein
MAEIYRKRGSILRHENGSFVLVREAGEAVEDGMLFRCAPASGAADIPAIDGAELRDFVQRVHEASGDLCIERLIATEGHAQHEFEGRSWSERTRRVHLSLTRGGRRVLIDEETYDTGAISEIAPLLSKMEQQRNAPALLRLAPRVTAALTRSLAGVAPPNVRLEQRAGGIDGKGNPILDSGGPVWPSWYRPSYRFRPMRTPFNLVARCSVSEVDTALPRAVALLAPPHGLVLEVLCVDGEDVYPTVARIIRIDAIAEPDRRYPYGPGVWAGEAEVAT